MSVNPIAHYTTLGLAALGVLAVSSTAEAAFTLQASVGTSFLLVSNDDIDSDRGPVTFDIGPGWNFAFVRVEVPLVFGIDEANVYPRSRSTFLGFRPQAKVFPIDWLYGKLSTPILFPGGEGSEADIVLGITVGGGIEFGVADILLLHAELNLSPYVSPDTALPLEGRIGATLKF